MVLAILWGMVALLTVWLVVFGLSDLIYPSHWAEYAERNPMRPFFRLAFAGAMMILLNGVAFVISGRIRAYFFSPGE